MILVPGLAILVTALIAESTDGAELEADIRQIVEEERSRGATPAMSVVVIRDGQVLLEYASGLADAEAQRVAAVDTLYPAASVSKILAAALVMKQVEEGRLDLDETVNSYLTPEFWVRDSAGNPAPATLRQLLSHNSGLPVSWNGIVDWGNPVPTLEEHLSQGLKVVYPPGERIVYANNGFALAGYVAARAAGQSFSEYARDALFEPLGMSLSTFESPWTIEGSMAAAYGHWFRSGSERTRHANLTAIAPAGGLITTARDLGRFALLILGEGELDGVRILRQESVAEMIRMQARVHPESDQGFGLGFAIREQPGRHEVWWDGSQSGAAARLALLPDEDAGVVVLSNLANNEPSSVTARRILEAVVSQTSNVSHHPSAAELDSVAGLYRPIDFVDPNYWYLNYLLAFEVRRDGQTLVQNSRMTDERTMTPVGPGRFRMRGSWLDNSMILFDNDDLHIGYLRASRISYWQSPTALAVYAAFLSLTGLALLVRRTYLAMQRKPGPKRKS